MILNGRIYTATELHEMGLIDVLVDTGQGHNAIEQLVSEHARRWNAFRALKLIKRQQQPITEELLRTSSRVWVDAAMRLSSRDLRLMERLVRAQDRRLGIGAKAPEAAPRSRPATAVSPLTESVAIAV